MRTRSCTLLAAALALGAGAAPARAQDAPRPATAVRAPSRNLKRQALVIGAGAYTKAAPIAIASQNARSFADFLKSQWGYTDASITLMTDDASGDLRPTRENIEAQAKRLVEKANKDSEIVVYFSGYGSRVQGNDWLVPLDGDLDNLPGTCVSSDRLIDDLVTKAPKRALLFLDADRNLQKDRTPGQRSFARLPRSARNMELGVLYSCEAGERSREGRNEQVKPGVFTHYLLQGLKGDREAAGSDGTITFDGLRKYVFEKVRSYVTSEYKDYQSPYAKTTNAGMVLGVANK